MAAPIYTLKNIELKFGGKPLFSGVEMYVNQGDKISLVGRNGSGKSTLLKIISGILEADAGEIFIQPSIKISYMPQDPNLSEYETLKDAVLSGLENDGLGEEYKADILLEKLDFNGAQKIVTASGGELRKASLAKALISDPDILLLDEPTNHLDIKAIETLENIINDFRGAIIIISHDRMFLNNVSKTTFWLDRGVIHRNNKGFEFFEEWQDALIENEIKEQEKLNKKISEETEWLHTGVTARRKRNMGRLRRLQELRKIRREQLKPSGNIKLEVEECDFRSRLVINAKNIAKSFGDREIIKSFTTRVIKGNKIGIVGPNGSGKTTLVKILTGRLKPDSGFVKIGKNLEEAYFDQNRISLDPKKTLWQTLCAEGDHIMVHGKYRHVVAYLKDFLFKPDQAHTPVSALSGGEKNRLMLAVALAQKSNFLILDEPTNDLDMDTLDLLQEVLSDYEGTILIVSHDRDFLDKVVTSVIHVPGDGTVTEYAGSYSDLLEKIKLKEPAEIVAVRKAKQPQITSSNTAKPKKLSYNQKRLLEVLPTEIAKLEQDISDIELELSDSELYTSDADKFNHLTKELTEKKQLIEDKETAWLEIQLELEGIEQ